MNIITELQSSTKDKATLEAFIKANAQEIHDFLLTQNHSNLLEHKDSVEGYISSSLQKIKKIDLSIDTNVNFCLILLMVSERFSFFTPFQQLFNFLKRNEVEVGFRMEAAALLFINMRRITDYEERLSPFIDLLSKAYYEDEESQQNITGTLVNFYAQLVNNFAERNSMKVLEINKKTIELVESSLPFLKNACISICLNVDISDFRKAFSQIQSELDKYLDRNNRFLPFSGDYALVEQDTEYVTLLQAIPHPSFKNIRGISVDKYRPIRSDDIFYSLNHGVEVLSSENQLFAYLFSYGNMHAAKIAQGLSVLPTGIFNQEFDIIDWGCGQGLATVNLIDYAVQNGYTPDIKQVTLIEPSKLALKRASLHAQKFLEANKVHTINKDLDSLIVDDLPNIKSRPKIHLFSNILDVELFSLTKLQDLIDKSFKGENYFVCVSPYINSYRTVRLDSFMKHYESKDGYANLQVLNKSKGEWERNWTICSRIFTATL